MFNVGFVLGLLMMVLVSGQLDNKISHLYLNKNLCKVDGYDVDIKFAISILFSYSLLGCASDCMGHPECVSVIFDQSTHFCQMNNQTIDSISSCGNLKYIQLYQTTSTLSTCCSSYDESQVTLSEATVTTPSSSEETTEDMLNFVSVPNSDMWVYIQDKKTNGFQAKSKCQDNGGRLAILNIKSKHNAVRDFLQNTDINIDRVFIGLGRGFSSWKWHDGSRLEFSKWDKSPEFLKTCVVMDKSVSYKWLAVSCFGQYGYICERI